MASDIYFVLLTIVLDLVIRRRTRWEVDNQIHPIV